jgi:hypothetical protein
VLTIPGPSFPTVWQVLGGELFHLLEEYGKMEESAVVFYAACITLALQHLHNLGIAYRDLKTENVLLTGYPAVPQTREEERMWCWGASCDRALAVAHRVL